MIPFLLMLAPAAVPAPVQAPWTPRVKTDAARGVTSTSVAALSHDRASRLLVKCDAGADKVVSVQFVMTAPLGGGLDRPVSLTADADTALIANWEFPGAAAFIRDDAAVTTLAAAIAKARSIKIHTTTGLGAPIDAVYDGPAGGSGVATVLKACGYVLGQVPVRTPSPAAPAPQ